MIPTCAALLLALVTQPEPANFETIKEGVREVYAQDLDLYQQILTQQRKTSTIEVMMR